MGEVIARAGMPRWLTEQERETISPAAPTPEGKRSLRPRPSRDELVAALTAHGWSLRATARHYERDRKQIVRWVEMYAIDVPWRAGE